MGVKEQVARGAAEETIGAEQIAIPVAVEAKIPDHYRETNLIALRQIVERFSLKIGKTKNRRVVGEMILVVNFTQQIADVAFPAGDQIRTPSIRGRTINHCR